MQLETEQVDNTQTSDVGVVVSVVAVSVLLSDADH